MSCYAKKCVSMNYIFPNYAFVKNISFSIYKKSKLLYLCFVVTWNVCYVHVVTFLILFIFLFFPFSISYLYLLLCEEFLIFLRTHIVLVIPFSCLRRTFYNTWKSHCRELQVLMIFNKIAITAQKMKFFINDFLTSTEEIVNRKLRFLCSVL